MADEQDTPESKPGGESRPEGRPPTKKTPAKKAPAKKTLAKAPAKKAAAKKTPAKKAPAKKAAAKKAPAKAAKTAPVQNVPPPAQPSTNTLTDAAKETAAQAKSTVTGSRPVLVAQPAPRSKLPVAAAVAAGLLAVLVVFLTRRDSGED